MDKQVPGKHILCDSLRLPTSLIRNVIPNWKYSSRNNLTHSYVPFTILARASRACANKLKQVSEIRGGVLYRTFKRLFQNKGDDIKIVVGTVYTFGKR